MRLSFGTNNRNSIELDISIPPHKVELYKTTHHPYYFFTQEYMQNSVGTRPPYYLCHLLNEFGYEAYVIADQPVVGMRTPILTNEIRQIHKAEGRSPITVYNETCLGNPLEGDVVVRWIMNKKVYVDGEPIPFSPDDLIFYWSSIYTESKNDKILWLPVVDTSIFNTDGAIEEERTGFCYYAHKYLRHNDGHVKLPEWLIANGTSLCQDIKRSPLEIADILRRSKVLYCYEPSAIMGEAEFCGCPTILVKTDYLSDFAFESIHFKYPIISEEEIDIDNPYLKVDPNHYSMFYEYYNKLLASTGGSVKSFVEITQVAAKTSTHSNSEPDRLRVFCERHTPVYIYGGGTIARQCHRVMKAMNINMDGCIVSDSFEDLSSVKNSFHDFDVFHLSEIEHQKEHCGLVLAMSIENQDEVIKNLERHKFLNYIRHSLLCPAVGYK